VGRIEDWPDLSVLMDNKWRKSCKVAFGFLDGTAGVSGLQT
jgi:hypothetical protein